MADYGTGKSRFANRKSRRAIKYRAERNERQSKKTTGEQRGLIRQEPPAKIPAKFPKPVN